MKIKNGILLNERLVEQSFFKSLKNFAFKLTVSEKDILIYKKIIKDSQKLGLHVCINTGVVAHSKLGSSINFKKDDVIHKEYQEGFKPYVIGSNISRYKITFTKHYIDYDSKANFFHRPKFKLLFESPKIIVRRISGKNNYLMACYDENKYYSNDNLMHVLHWTNELLKFQKPEKKWSIVVDSNLSLKYILSIIESDVFTFYFSKFLSTDTLQGTYSSIYPEDLREIPIIPLKESEQKPFVIFVEYLLFLNSKTNYPLLISYFDNILNCCVYEVYFSSELQIAGKEILKHLGDLKPLKDDNLSDNRRMSDEEKLAIIQSEFERLYDPNHPVRNNVETLDSVEEVRIIKEALK